MAAPKFTQTPNLGRATIVTASAQIKNDGTSAGSAGADIMYKVFTAGANGSYLEKIRFFSVAAAAAQASVATTLRAYVSTVESPGATTSANTFLIGEIAVPIITSSHSTSSTPGFDLIVEMAIPTGSFVHVSQHIAQTVTQWNALAIGGDY